MSALASRLRRLEAAQGAAPGPGADCPACGRGPAKEGATVALVWPTYDDPPMPEPEPCETCGQCAPLPLRWPEADHG